MSTAVQPDGYPSADDRLRDIVDHLDRDEAGQALELLNPLVSLEKPSTDMSATKSQTLTESMAGKLPGGMVAHQESGMVDVVKVDKDKNQITVKRPNGEMDVINVKDPDLQSHLSDIKEGDKIQASYTEAAVISFERPNKKTNTKSSRTEDTSQPEQKAM